MSKIVDYPRASMKNAIDLAIAVDELGGSCSIEMAADKLNKKVSGAFNSVIGASSRYGLIKNQKGKLTATKVFRDLKLAYNETEKQTVLRQIFLNIPVFKGICDRFNGRQLPVDHFDKLLIKEFGVPDNMGSRVFKYFMEGAKLAGMLGAENNLISNSHQVPEQSSGEDVSPSENDVSSVSSISQDTNKSELLTSVPSGRQNGDYSIRIQGPDMDMMITIREEDDFLILEAMLKKVKKNILKLKGDE